MSYSSGVSVSSSFYSNQSQPLQWNPFLKICEDDTIERSTFSVERLAQTYLLGTVNLPNKDVRMHQSRSASIKVLQPFAMSVGMIRRKEGKKGIGIGSCVLISKRLVLTAYHTIEGIVIENLRVRFGYVKGLETSKYRVKGVVDFNQNLGYAVLKLNRSVKNSSPLLIDEEISSEPIALLHHPLQKRLRVSINTFAEATFESNFLSSHHDTDFGSSGGGYINADGRLVALHLGAVAIFRGERALTFERLALPISKIIEQNPDGITAQLIQGYFSEDKGKTPITKGRQKRVEKLKVHSDPIPVLDREHDFVERQNFVQKRLTADGAYLVVTAKDEKPAVYIDPHQRKHTPNWPAPPLTKGTSFSGLTLGEIVVIGEKIVTQLAFLQDGSPTNRKPDKERISIERTLFVDSKDLYNKIKHYKEIEVISGFENGYWGIHFYPVKK